MTSTYARANFTHPKANFNAPLAQHHVRHLCAHITVLVGVAVGGWAETPLKCGHLSFSLKIIDFHSIYTIHSSYLKGGTNSCPITRIAVDSEVLYHGDYILHRLFQARRRGCVQTKTSEGGRIRMRADYYYFAPTGGRYQTVFRGTLPRRYSIRRSRCGNSEVTALAVQQSMVHTYDETITYNNKTATCLPIVVILRCR